MQTPVLVVPCYNESARFQHSEWKRLLELFPCSLLFVNDGSTDRTAEILDRFSDSHKVRVKVLTLPLNAGKGEAVRLGLLKALEGGAGVVGYLDADFATPPGEVARVLGWLEQAPSDMRIALGSRIQVLGSDIKRKATRHYLGRVFATFASLLLRMPVYDTQCGFKVFRCPAELAKVLAEPFHSRWIFDVELIGRLKALIPYTKRADNQTWIEIPLKEWRDVGGSKLGFVTMAGALWDLTVLYWKFRT